MQRFKPIFGIAALVIVTLGTAASASAQVRIGTIDMKRAFAESRIGRDAQDKLLAEHKVKQDRIDAETKEIERLYDRLKGPHASAKTISGVPDRLRALQELHAQLQKELEEAEAATSTRLASDIKSIIPSVAQDLKLSAVSDIEGVYFHDGGIVRTDITDEVVRRLDKKTPAPTK
jgi:Skp family chaperone for outer membrane proteins